MAILVCQAVGCPHPRKSSQFMCLPHWRALPNPLRTQINATWRAWNAAEGARRQDLWLDYIGARDEARRWTAEGEGRIGQYEPDAPRIKALRAARATTPTENA